MQTRDMEGVKKSSLAYTVDPALLIIDEDFNPRSRAELEKNIERLMPQIEAAGGVVEGIWVYRDDKDDRLHVLSGATRTLCAQRLKILAVPILEKKAPGLAERLAFAIQGNQGSPLTPWDLGKSFMRLENVGWPVETIAKHLGFAESSIRKYITLADTPEEMRADLSAGVYSAPAALSELAKPGTKDDAVKRLRARSAASGGAPVKREKAEPKNLLKSSVLRFLEENAEDLAIAEEQAYDEVSISFDSLKRLAALVK